VAAVTVAGALELKTVDEAARIVGVATSTYCEWFRRGRAPGIKLPGTRRILVDQRSLEAWISGATLIAKELGDGGRLVEPKGKR
jgi:excisionase family DNA binding protein